MRGIAFIFLSVIVSEKHHFSFKEYEQDVKEEEDFQKWDDYIEWKAYSEKLKALELRLKEINC